MKNIHVIATDKPSRLYEWGKKELKFTDHPITNKRIWCQNIYITSDEEIKMGEEVWYLYGDEFLKNRKDTKPKSFCKKIILTTNTQLIKDGVQAIDDEFLEWFVKNPSCEKIEIVYTYIAIKISKPSPKIYKIIIPKEEPKIISDWLEQNRNPEIDKQVEKEAEQLSKQETLEETAKRYSKNKLSKLGFIEGAKWQAERMYNEEEVIDLIQSLSMNEDFNGYGSVSKETAKYFLEQFKKNRL
jgi:hypothetical protein